MAEYTLNKSEKLKSRKSIEALFHNGRTIISPPFKLLYKQVDFLPAPAQMTVAVPKRLVRRAVDRNLIKRRTREAYRLRKNLLFEALSAQGAYFEIIFLYQSGEPQDYNSISNSINFLLIRLRAIVEKSARGK